MEPIISTNHSMYNPESFSADHLTYTDGRGIEHNFVVGDVLRPNDPYFPFGDSVIAGFDAEGNAQLLRPYLYVSTVTRSGLVGYETIDRLPPATLLNHWKKIGTGRTT